ncbi:MAG TPA: right-handed parallel beta-helix repeat-containing protein, partial [Kofleriaceae bacterium]
MNNRYVRALGALALVATAACSESEPAGALDPELESKVVFAPPFVTYEAESGSYTGSLVGPGTTYHTVESEASGRKYVHLAATGSYVQWTTTAAGNGLNLRYNMPDAAGGGGTTGTLSLYVNGAKVQTLNLSSKFAWVYGDTVSNPVWYSNDPSAGSPHRFFDQTHFLLATTIPAGATVKLQKDAADAAAYYNIDFIDLESVPGALGQPAGSQSITSFGAVANDGNDDTAAFNSAVSAAGNGGTVWIPAGTFSLNSRPNAFANNVTIRGAGMWYSVLDGVGASFTPNAKTIKLYDFAMSGGTTLRDDSQLQAGIDGGGNGFGANSVVQNLWLYHLKVGIWTGPTTLGLAISNSRVWDTYADGINLYNGTTSSSVTNTSVRNTGDDGIAIWSGGGNACTNNLITGNRVQFPIHANGIAVYGGAGNTVQDNTVSDIVQYGSGIYLANRFGEVPFSGTTTVTGNTLTRTGSFDPDYGYGDGGIRLEANDASMAGTYTISNNTVDSPTYAGVLFVGSGAITGVTFSNLLVSAPGTSGIETRNNVRGSATLTGSTYGTITNAAGANFVITSSGSGGATGAGGGGVTPVGPSGFTYVADENATYTLPAVGDVAYGANGSFNYRYAATGAVTFNNATFQDPSPGATKHGFYRAGPAGPAGYTYCAPDLGSFTLPSSSDVAYGANGAFA